MPDAHATVPAPALVSVPVLPVLRNRRGKYAAALLVASVSGKLLATHIAGRVLKWPAGEGRLIGWFLQTKALIMIIFANVLLDKQVITSETFTALLLMAVASTMLTVPMVTPMLKRMPGVAGRES